MRVDLPVLRIKASFLAELQWLAGDPRNPVYWIDFLKAERALKIALLENPVSQHRVESLWDKHIANDDEIRAIFSYVHDLAKMYAVLSLSRDKSSTLVSVLRQKEIKMLNTEQDVVEAIHTHFQQLKSEEGVSAGNERRDRFQARQTSEVSETSLHSDEVTLSSLNSEDFDTCRFDVEDNDAIPASQSGALINSGNIQQDTVDEEGYDAEGRAVCNSAERADTARIACLFRLFSTKAISNIRDPVDRDLVAHFKKCQQQSKLIDISCSGSVLP